MRIEFNETIYILILSYGRCKLLKHEKYYTSTLLMQIFN